MFKIEKDIMDVLKKNKYKTDNMRCVTIVLEGTEVPIIEIEYRDSKKEE